ncbi:MAG: hypothetical protein KFF68_05105, partial [Desulfosarcina sp.]|nr:hypothetical protein [Desulfosarcina sp.]
WNNFYAGAVRFCWGLSKKVILAAPIAWWGVGQLRGNGDNTVRQGFPRPGAGLWLDRGFYQAVEGWFEDSLPAGKPLRIFHNWLNYHLFSATSTPAVHLGNHGWLYPKKTSQGHSSPAVDRQQGYRLFLELHAAEKIINATGRRFLVTVVPGKAAIYPEYVGSGHPGPRSRSYQALIDANRRHPLSGFAGLDAALKKVKLGGVDVYHQRSRLWTCSGAAAAAQRILNVQTLATPSYEPPSAACPPPDDDLYRLILGKNPQEDATSATHAGGSYATRHRRRYLQRNGH